MGKKFEKLQIRDDFMFSIIMRNPRFCKPFLERVLGIKISHIKYPKAQETINISADAKSDGTTKIVLNTKGTMDDVSPEMKKLLDFIDGKEPEDEFTKELNEAVQSVRKNERWRLDYMTLYMKYQEKFEEGYDKGVEQGIEQGIEQGDRKRAILVAKKMIEDGNLPIEKIVTYSGLTLEQVIKLKKDLQ